MVEVNMEECESEKYFGCAISLCRFIPRGLTCFFFKENFVIALWNCNKIVFLCLNDKNCHVTLKKRNHFEKEELELSASVVDILVINEVVYVFLIDGTILKLLYGSDNKDKDRLMHSDDSDLFEMSPEYTNKWLLKKLRCLSQCDKLLAVSVVNYELIVTTVHFGKLLGQVYCLNSLQQKLVVSLLDSTVDTVVLTTISLPLSFDLKKQYFSFLINSEIVVPIVGLRSGQAISFSLLNQSSHVVFSSVQPIVNFGFVSDKRKEECTTVLVVFESGSLAVLKGKSSQMLCINSSIVYSLFHEYQSIMISSDGLNCAVSEILFEDCLKETKLKCPIKGVRGVCFVPKHQDLVLIATRHNCIYWLDLKAIKEDKSTKFIMPKDELINKLLETARCLNDAHLKMKEEESKIKAISLATRAKFLEKHFTILVKFFSGKTYFEDKLKVRIECDCDFVSFTEDLWSLNMSLSDKNSAVLSVVHKLEKPFKKDSPLDVEFKCSPVIESEISCKMVACLDANQHSLIVPLGKVVIDAGYFLNIVKDKSKLLKLMIEPSVKNFHNTFDNILNNNGEFSTDKSRDEKHEIDKKIFVYSMKLDLSVPANKIFQIIFCNSSHRMSKTQWIGISDDNFNEVSVLIGHKFWAEINLDERINLLTIKSNDIYACYLIKRAVSSRLGCNEPVPLDSDVYIEAEGIKYRFELARLKSDWNIKEFQDIKSEFRSHIINKFSMQKK